jgi:DNA-directed RNA polymerase subunit H (RpoH/RPB5)
MERVSVQDIIIRSRVTILDLLEGRQYDTTPYRKLVGPDLVKLMGNPGALRINVRHKQDTTKNAIVEYTISNIKQQIGSGKFVKDLLQEENPDTNALYNINPETTEVIIIYTTKNTSEDIESYDKASLEAWTQHNFRIQFFPMVRLVNNPLKHMLQPKFEVVPKENHEELKKELYARSITQFPLIRYHHDMVARCLGLIPGDIVKITRPSYSSGEYTLYRTCAP